MPRHHLADGKLLLYRRKGSPYWQCAADLGGKKWRVTTREPDLARARDVAEDWYRTLRDKLAAGTIRPLRRFRDVATVFLDAYVTLTAGQRNPRTARSHAANIRLYLDPFFGAMPVETIKTGTVVSYRAWRQKKATVQYGRPAAPSTVQHEIVTLRLIMQTAELHGWIDYQPDFSDPYPSRTKVSRRAWFSPEDYARLCRKTWSYARNPPPGGWQAACRQLHDYVVFVASTGLRPDEAARLEFRDVVIDEEQTDEPILAIAVRGKRGTGCCISMPNAVRAFRRLSKRHALARGEHAAPTDKLFPLDHRRLFNRILEELELKTDREGRPRTAYSLRHSYICFRLMNGADIYQLSKNCRTSVGVIEQYYAAHIAARLDASLINGRANAASQEYDSGAD